MKSESGLIVPKRSIKIVPMMVLKPMQSINYHEKAIAAEPTGKGEVLCIEGFFGRMFRSDPGCVRDELDKYSEKYREICDRYDEDPAHEYYEVLNWNDLYYLHGIIPSIAGGNWGYTNTPDYRCSDIVFDSEYVEDGEWYDMFGEAYFYYNPREYSVPMECYMEV